MSPAFLSLSAMLSLASIFGSCLALSSAVPFDPASSLSVVGSFSFSFVLLFSFLGQMDFYSGNGSFCFFSLFVIIPIIIIKAVMMIT